MAKCVFCRIVKAGAPAVKVYEDRETIVFLDKAPFNLGHILVIPKKHYRLITDMSEEEVGKLFMTVRRLAKAIFQATEADGLNIGQSNGEVASQDIPHVHVHIVPRFRGDAEHNSFPSRKRLKPQELEETGRRIREALESEIKV